jgi:hypothetical protein
MSTAGSDPCRLKSDRRGGRACLMGHSERPVRRGPFGVAPPRLAFRGTGLRINLPERLGYRVSATESTDKNERHGGQQAEAGWENPRSAYVAPPWGDPRL